jgi:hypothetical protein
VFSIYRPEQNHEGNGVVPCRWQRSPGGINAAFGEVHHWPEPLVNSAVCDEAILGVNCLMPIFGVYFALRLSLAAAARPKSAH